MATIRHIIGTLTMIVALPVAAQVTEEATRCVEFIEENWQEAQTSDDCLAAADQGFAGIQYQVGMGYGFAGDSLKEFQWYLRSAQGGFVEAYLAIGHTMRAEPIADIDQAVSWYAQYWYANGQAKGYAAALLHAIELERGNHEEAELWLQRCNMTEYAGCASEN